MAPPPTTHRQHTQLPMLMIGSADSTPMAIPAYNAGWAFGAAAVISVVILPSQMGDQVLSLQIPQGVLQLHQQNEQIVLGVQARRVHRALVIEREPFLNAAHARPPGKIAEQRGI